MDHFPELEDLRAEYERLKYPLDERRKFPRRIGAIPVRFLGDELSASLLTSIDVGGGGIRLCLRNHLNFAGEYDLEFLLEGIHQPIKVKCKPVWQRRANLPEEFYEVGLMFKEINSKDQQLVVEYAKSQSKPEQEEKRKYLRIPRLLPSTVFKHFPPKDKDKDKEALYGLIIDISEAGTRILLARALPPNTHVTLKIELEEGSPIEVMGEVVWENRVEALRTYQHGLQYVHGIRFIQNLEHVRAIIEDYLKFKASLTEANLVDIFLRLTQEKKHP